MTCARCRELDAVTDILDWPWDLDWLSLYLRCRARGRHFHP